MPESFPAARSADLFVAFPEAPLDFGTAWCRESDPVLVDVSDRQGPASVAAFAAVFERVQRLLQRTR